MAKMAKKVDSPIVHNAVYSFSLCTSDRCSLTTVSLLSARTSAQCGRVKVRSAGEQRGPGDRAEEEQQLLAELWSHPWLVGSWGILSSEHTT